MVDVVLHLVRVRKVFCREHHAVALCTAAQKIIAGNIIIVCHAHHKVQAAFADAFFVVGQQRLRDAKILGGLLLGDAAFLAQQLDDTVEFHDFWLLKVRYRGTSLFLVYSRLIIHNGKPFVKQEM